MSTTTNMTPREEAAWVRLAASGALMDYIAAGDRYPVLLAREAAKIVAAGTAVHHGHGKFLCDVGYGHVCGADE